MKFKSKSFSQFTHQSEAGRLTFVAFFVFVMIRHFESLFNQMFYFFFLESKDSTSGTNVFAFICNTNRLHKVLKKIFFKITFTTKITEYSHNLFSRHFVVRIQQLFGFCSLRQVVLSLVRVASWRFCAAPSFGER